jgi:alkanesulfonate monooxygenase SsuD/methylene tetrahydromethanopterin reductase-like flavin-dependent oxidoreductase (luciferase family)
VHFGNTAEGFLQLDDRISRAADAAGRDPTQLERSACVLIVLDRSARERLPPPGTRPLEGSPERIAAGLRELAEAGADEVILVVTPISERSILELAELRALV